jgi:hypothetical protein
MRSWPLVAALKRLRLGNVCGGGGHAQVAYEYVACQEDMHGVLILSEFAGAAQSLYGSPSTYIDRHTHAHTRACRC